MGEDGSYGYEGCRASCRACAFGACSSDADAAVSRSQLPEEVVLFPGGAPGEESFDAENEVTKPGDDGLRRVFHVSKPTVSAWLVDGVARAPS